MQAAPAPYVRTRLSIMMFLQYAIWGAWLPILYPFISGHRKFSDGEVSAVFAAGATGCTLGFLLQSFTNSYDFSIWALVWVTGYPFLISGKPLLSFPAFVPVMFELTILLSALTAAFGMLAFNQLPELYHPLLKHPGFGRATDDRFFISIEARDPQFLRSKTGEFLKSLGASSVEVVES